MIKAIIDALEKIKENSELMNPKIEESLNFSQIHCIHAIGNIEEPNVTKIALELGMTTGAITKMFKKLHNLGFTEKYQKPENSKEVYYKLTETGKRVYDIHKKIHDKLHSDKESVISQYSDQEKTTILKFLSDINSMMNKEYTEMNK